MKLGLSVSSSIRVRWLRGLVAGFVIILFHPVQAMAQEVTASVDITQEFATSFCNRLREAVRIDNRSRVSRRVALFPIEVQRDGKNILILDDTDFISKFDVIFDSHMREVLFSPRGCKLRTFPDGTFRLAEGQIVLAEADKDRGPWIEAISPPKDVSTLKYLPNAEYERGADRFFKALQRAIKADDRDAVASMCSYPIRVVIKGKDHWIENRAELIRNYTEVFTLGLKNNIAALQAPIHVGWRGFMTRRGELWLDAIVWTHVYRVVGINGSF